MTSNFIPSNALGISPFSVVNNIKHHFVSSFNPSFFPLLLTGLGIIKEEWGGSLPTIEFNFQEPVVQSLTEPHCLASVGLEEWSSLVL